MTNLKLSFLLKLEYEEINVDWSVSEVRAQNYSTNAIQKSDTKVNVSTFKDKNSLTQKHELQRNKAQMKNQEERLIKKVHELETQKKSQKHEM